MDMENMIDSNKKNEIKLIKKQLIFFLIITFAVTYAGNFTAIAVYGPISSTLHGSEWSNLLATQMLFPALSAIACLLIFKDKRLNRSNRLLFGYFLIFLVLSVIMTFYNPTFDIPGSLSSITLFQVISGVFGIIGFILIIVLNARKSSREELKSLGMSFGNNKIYYLIFSIFYILLLTVSMLLNYPFKLQNTSVTPNAGLYAELIAAGMINSIMVAWMYFFGEEFGWRVYLQERLTQVFDVKKGIIITGLIWGLWHAPIIASGYNYPGHPVSGVIIMICFCVVIGILFSFAVIKTGSVWVSVLLHAITNTVLPVAMMYLCRPKDVIYSFGMGIYGIILIGVVSLIIMIFGNWTRNSKLILKRGIKQIEKD
jgi:uncharacterized protein